MKPIAAMLCLLALLAACGGGGGGAAPIPPPTVSSFDVTGTSADAAGRAPIAAGQNGGNFTITVGVTNSGAEYTIGMAVSPDATASSGDIVFLDELCESDGDCITGGPFVLDCNFDNQNEIGCTIDGVTNKTDLSTFLDMIPKDAFLIVEVCDEATGNVCSYAAHAVQFQ